MSDVLVRFRQVRPAGPMTCPTTALSLAAVTLLGCAEEPYWELYCPLIFIPSASLNIRDEATDAAVARADVAFLASDAVVATNPLDVPVGDYVLRVSAPGYHQRYQPVEIPGGVCGPTGTTITVRLHAADGG